MRIYNCRIFFQLSVIKQTKYHQYRPRLARGNQFVERFVESRSYSILGQRQGRDVQFLDETKRFLLW